jgi:hypothetical protein
MLDHAAVINEAVQIMESYNIDFWGGSDIHYLIADESGAAVQSDYVDRRVQAIFNKSPWHLATIIM